MKSIFACGIITFFFFPIFALGSKPAPKINIKVKFDQSFYNLEINREILKYSEGARAYGIKIKDCNRQKVSEIETAYKTLLNEYSRQPPRHKTKYDIEISAGEKKIDVARGSSLGTWLREMPKKIMYINAEAQALCKR